MVKEFSLICIAAVLVSSFVMGNHAKAVTVFERRDDPDYRYTGYLVFDYFITDEDGKAIKAARFFNVSFIITPKIVVELFRLQKISFKKARESLEKLSKIGRYSPEIGADALISFLNRAFQILKKVIFCKAIASSEKWLQRTCYKFL